MTISFYLFLLGILRIQITDGFLPLSTPKRQIPEIQTKTISTINKYPTGTFSINNPRKSKISRLHMDLWERMEIEEDDEPYWYLLNCVAGLEMDLLRQVRQVSEKLPPEDVVKFVVPTVVKTRSHGANRMVRETKVKYQGYVFAKLRLTKETYETIKKMDLCRSWMGTINMKGYKKLPPAPLPLSEEEIDNFDLENPLWESDLKNEAPEKNQGIIVDTYENDIKELEEEEAIEAEVKTVYKSLKVEDMIKVTAGNKFSGEDGIVKRLKEGKILIRFFTYGQTFDEWLVPTDVRKLTDEEILKGLGGPSAPITQRDLDGANERDRKPQQRGYRVGDDARNSVGAFGGGPGRERRQDRTERRFRNDPIDEKKERENWNWYKENEKRSQGGGYDDGDGVEFRAGSLSESKRGPKKGNFWEEGDVDSQWGRKKKNSERQLEDDWSSFVSQAPSNDKKRSNSTPSREETDDFFASLMTDLSNDIDAGEGPNGASGSQAKESAGPGNDDDDFFETLMSEIEDKPSGRTKQSPSTTKRSNNGDDDDDFFASLERDIIGPTNRSKSTDTTKTPIHDEVSSSEDDFFSSLEMELASDLGELKENRPRSESVVNSFPVIDDASDDFFASLEEGLRSDLDDLNFEGKNSITTAEVVQLKSSPQGEVDDAQKNEHGFDEAALKKRTVAELKSILRDRGLKVSGKKAELIERITSAV